LIPFGAVTVTMLRRNLEYGALYKIAFGQTATRSITTIGLAYLGFGYMSMAWAAVAAIVANIVGCGIWGWRYRVRGLSLSRWRRVLPFSAKRIVIDVVETLGSESANVVVGKMLGMADVGFYSRGYSIVNMFRTKVMGAITSVAYPALAKAHRLQDTAPSYYLNILVHITAVALPFFAFGAIMAPSIIFFAFGHQWAASVPIMRWLCVAAMFGSLIFQCGNFLTAIGRVGSVAAIQVRYQLARLALTITAAFYSLEAVAAAQILVYIIATVLYYRDFYRYPALRPSKVFKALLPSFAITAASCVVPATMSIFWPGFVSDHRLPALILAAVGAGAGWLIGVFLTKHPLVLEIGQGMSSFARNLRSLSNTR
jgi:O-antigen/teichoic acid export membrane protein